jgi:hypothetical protein
MMEARPGSTFVVVKADLWLLVAVALDAKAEVRGVAPARGERCS